MNIAKRMFAATAVLIFGMVLYACGAGTSSAVTGTLTQAQFDSLLSTSSAFTSLKAQVAAIGSAAVYIKAPNATAYSARSASRRTESVGGSNTGVMPAATTGCPGIGTLTGRPTSSDPLQSSIASGISCTGYYFDVSMAATSSEYGYIQWVPATAQLAWDGTNCTGNMYVGINGFGTGAATNGAVFRWAPGGEGAAGLTASSEADTSTYYEVKPGAAQTVTVLSTNGGADSTCTPATISGFVGYAVIPNNVTDSGIESAPIQGPIVITN